MIKNGWSQGKAMADVNKIRNFQFDQLKAAIDHVQNTYVEYISLAQRYNAEK